MLEEINCILSIKSLFLAITLTHIFKQGYFCLFSLFM